MADKPSSGDGAEGAPSASRAAVSAELIWSGDLRFGVTSGDNAIVTDGDNVAGPSPVQLLGVALAGCMAADIVDILRKGRHPLTAFRASLTGTRAPEAPKRLTSVHLHFHVHGDVPASAVERAMALSHEKYCSVSHSLRRDIDFTMDFDILP